MLGRETKILLAAAMLTAAGCGTHSQERHTRVPVLGYPYPFGVEVRNVLGKDAWAEDAGACPQHVIYSLREPAQRSRWSGYSGVRVVADTSGALQGFSASRSFENRAEAEQAILDLMAEIRRRYGAPTDSVIAKKTIVSASWQDTSGNVVGVGEWEGRMIVLARSGRVRKACPDSSNIVLESHPKPSGG